MTNALGTEKIAREDLAKKIEELEDSANLFNLLTEGSSDLIYVLDIKTEKFTFVSQSVERILGYTKDEALALRPRDVLTPESYRHQIDTFDRGRR